MTKNIAPSISIRTNEKRRSTFLLVYAIGLGILSIFNTPYISLFSLFVITSSVLFDKQLSLSLYICTAIVGADFSSTETFICALVILALGLSIFDFRNKKTRGMLLAVSLFSLSMFVGFVLGANSQIITIIVFSFKLFMMVTIAQSTMVSSEKVLEHAILYGGLVVAGVTAYHFYVGDVSVLSEGQGRLMYKENVKELSTAIVVPVYMAINKLFNYKNLRNRWELLSYVLVFSLCFPLLLMTYSRGVFIGLLVAVVFLQLSYSKQLSVQKIFIYTLIFLAIVKIISSMHLDESLIFENVEGGNGRTDIWMNYLALMEEQGAQTLIWGLGSNSYTEMLDFYDHSVILSYYFHFGIFGFCFIAYIVFITITRLLKGKNAYHLFLLVMTIIMFFTHGSYDNNLFYILTGLCLGMANKFTLIYGK